jgi:hypothetical protein
MALRIRASKRSLAIRYLPFLKALLKAIRKRDKRVFRQLLRSATESEMHALTEVAGNLVHGQFSRLLGKRKLEQLGAYKRGLRLLANRQIGSQKKKGYLLRKQVGGAFPLVAVLAPLITSLISGVLSR